MNPKLVLILKWVLLPITGALYSVNLLLALVFMIFAPIALAGAIFYGLGSLGIYLFGDSFMALLLIPVVLIATALILQRKGVDYEWGFEVGYMAVGNVFNYVASRLSKLLPFQKKEEKTAL